MDAHVVALAQREGLVHQIDRAQAGGARSEHDSADPARTQQVLQCVQVHAAEVVHRYPVPLHIQHLAHSAVCVVGLGAVGDALAGMQLAGDEQRLQVGDVPLVVRWPSVSNPTMAARCAAASRSMAATADPASSAWLLGLISIADR
jgi:hypothetical protein